MCGIVGFTGKRQAAPVLLDGLSKLEYRGYDSAGLAVRDGTDPVQIVKAKGRLKVLEEKTDGGHALSGTCGIGHTRWATHGEPSEQNAHPHCSDDGNVVGVHNGIIENYQELREKLLRNGYTFYSSTDTEVALKLIDYYSKKYAHTPVDAILKYTRTVYYVGNLELARLSPQGITFYNLDGDEIEKEPVEILWNAEAAEKGGYEHFMMKEIHEQPKAVEGTLRSLLKDGHLTLENTGLSKEDIGSFRQIFFIGCGSAYHVGVAAQYTLEDLTRLPVRVELASEFRYRDAPLPENTLAVIVSQSGETADSLAALRQAKEQGAKTLAIVNVVGSTIAREADFVLYTLAGPEIAVATTKAYSAQLLAVYALAIVFAQDRGTLEDAQVEMLVKELEALPGKMERVLEDEARIQWFAAKQLAARDAFFIGRGLDYAISLEGSLKMKEISYIHSEAYAAGELKHGTISLIEPGTLVVGILTQQKLYEKTLSNLLECKTRGAYLMALTTYGNYSIEDNADFVIYIPKTDPHFAPSLAILPLQLLGYYISVAKGLDVDKPRNLAKSVTVE